MNFDHLLEQRREKKAAMDEAAKDSIGKKGRNALESPSLPPPFLHRFSSFTRCLDADSHQSSLRFHF